MATESFLKTSSSYVCHVYELCPNSGAGCLPLRGTHVQAEPEYHSQIILDLEDHHTLTLRFKYQWSIPDFTLILKFQPTHSGKPVFAFSLG